MKTFHLQIMSLIRMLFDGEVESVYLSGDEGEYELLCHHFPLMGAIPEGWVQIAGHDPVPLRAGVVMFQENTCIIIIEEMDSNKAVGQKAEMDAADPTKDRKRLGSKKEE
ncbi:MAG: hypothetical protein Q8R76_01370 [Candidatus Omnitrophota bacterium]|nr:hypothetical protein [Candidatus Omnitrophota bacterium]